MATKKKGILTSAPQWWDHLKDWKRVFWSAERKAAKRQIKREINDGYRLQDKSQTRWR